MKKKNNNWTTVFLVLLLLAGVSLLLYPSLSDYWNSMHQTRAIASYAETVSQLDTAQYDEMWKAAQDYNRSLAQRETAFALTDEQKAAYESLLDVSGLGVMGYIEIPEIDCSLPIYHGTEESVLQVAVGHLEWSNLPVGGEGTHCVLSGHRGLPSAKLFTNLDKLAVGDTFLLRVLDEVLTYEVDQILIVEPEQVDALGIVPGEDYCTLVTCTPYGINTHRLLVRGHRVENTPEAARMHVTADATQFDPLLVAPVLAIPVLLLLLMILLHAAKPLAGGTQKAQCGREDRRICRLLQRHDAAGADSGGNVGVLLGAHKQKDAGLRAFADVEREAGAEFVRQRRIDDQKIKTALQKTSPRAGNVRRLYDRREAALRQKRQYVLREFLRSGDKQHTVAAL